MGQLHAAHGVGFAQRVAGRFPLITDRRAEIVAAAPDAPRKELLVDHPVSESVFVARDHLRPLGAKSGIKIFVAESDDVLFDVAVGIDDAHIKSSPVRWNRL